MKRRILLAAGGLLVVALIVLVVALAIMFPARSSFPPIATVELEKQRKAGSKKVLVQLLDRVGTAQVSSENIEAAHEALANYPYFKSAVYLATDAQTNRFAGNAAAGNVLLEKAQKDIRHTRAEYEGMYSLYLPTQTSMQFEVPRDTRGQLQFHAMVLPVVTSANGTELPVCSAELTVKSGGKVLFATQLELSDFRSDFSWREHSVQLDGVDSVELLSRRVGDCDGFGHVFVGQPVIVGQSDSAPTNVVYINIDALVPWALGAYGTKFGVSPAMDALANNGMRFDRAYISGNYSKSSHYSALMARYPGALGIKPYRHSVSKFERNNHAALRYPTIASVLREAGYSTYAITSNFFLSDFLKLGVDHGFERFVDNSVHIQSSIDIFNHSIDWLKKHGDRPFFLYLNPQNTHHKYRPPRDYIGTSNTSFWDLITDTQRVLFLAEVAYVDSLVGGLVAALESLSLRERTLIVIHSDHGDIWTAEHDIGLQVRDPYIPGKIKWVSDLMYAHGFTHFEEEVRVPLIFNLPKKIKPGYSDSLVSLIDVSPTILDVLDVAIPGSFTGRSILSTQPLKERAVFMEGKAVDMVVRGQHKYVFREPALATIKRPEWSKPRQVPEGLYNLKNDAKEMVNLAEHTEHTRELSELRALRTQLKPGPVQLTYLRLTGSTGDRLTGALELDVPISRLFHSDAGIKDRVEHRGKRVSFDLTLDGANAPLIAAASGTVGSVKVTLTRNGQAVTSKSFRCGPYQLPLSSDLAFTNTGVKHLEVLPGQWPELTEQRATAWLWTTDAANGGPQGVSSTTLGQGVMDALKSWGYAK